MKSYNEICDDMNRYMHDIKNSEEIRQTVLEWASEFSEFNYHHLVLMIGLIRSLIHDDEDDDEMSEYIDEKNKETLAFVWQYANNIYQRGGMIALQANYYIMTNFMGANDIAREMEVAWHGVGEWQR
jgi:Rad3-related DNA helicase